MHRSLWISSITFDDTFFTKINHCFTYPRSFSRTKRPSNDADRPFQQDQNSFVTKTNRRPSKPSRENGTYCLSSRHARLSARSGRIKVPLSALARSSVRLSNRSGPMAVLGKGNRRLLNRCYHPIKLLIKDKVVGDRDWGNRPHKIEKKTQRISKMSLSRPPWPVRTYAPQKGSTKLKAQRILILNFVLPLFFPVFLSVLLSWLAWQACADGVEAEGLDGQM